MMGLLGRKRVEIRCAVDIEKTPESFHAYAIPQGIDIRPGDILTMHDVPAAVVFGERIVCECRATVQRAGPIERLWTRIAGFAELTELYEVGFSPWRAP